MKSPCKRDCPDRRAGTKDAPSCHSSCEAYQQYWEENRRLNEENLRGNDLDGFKIAGIRKAKQAARAMKGKNYQDKRRG